LYEQTCFNARLQPAGIRLGVGTTAGSVAGCANSGSDLLNLSYGYADASGRNNGNMQTQTISRSGMVGDYQYYGYDPLNRLRFAAEYAAPTTPSGTPCSDGGQHWCEGYTVDPVGNRILSAGHSEPQAPATFDQFNRAVTAAGGGSFAYDGRGNQITTAGVTPQSSFGYDAENRQVAYCPSGAAPCTTATPGAAVYVYDAAGLRVAKGGSIYVHDSQGQLSVEYETTATPGTQYLTADALGSTRMITDGNGTVQNCKDYYPYGGEVPATSATGRSGSCWTDVPETLRFTGKERDAETGLDYFGARYFSGAMGRFTSPDPGSAGAVPSNPQSWNAYSYALNNPLRLIDPTGMYSEESGDDGRHNLLQNLPRIDPCARGCMALTGDPHLSPGAYPSTDNRYVMFVDPHGDGRLDRTGAEPTVGPEFDIVAGGAKFAGAGFMALLRPALRAAARRLGLEVGADVGIALSRAAIGDALADEARVLHAAKNLVKGGVLEEGTNAALAAGTRAVAREILSNPIASFVTRIGTAAGETAVRVFVGQSSGRLVGVAIADEAAGAVAKGQIVTTLILK
jgi:RHS repeat-associated protein